MSLQLLLRSISFSLSLLITCLLSGQSASIYLEHSNTKLGGERQVELQLDGTFLVDNIFKLHKGCNPCELNINFVDKQSIVDDIIYLEISGFETIEPSQNNSGYLELIAPNAQDQNRFYYIILDGSSPERTYLDVVGKKGAHIRLLTVNYGTAYQAAGMTNPLALKVMDKVSGLMVGLLFVFLFLSLVSFFITKSSDYYYYSFYIVALLIYFAVRSESEFLINVFNFFQDPIFLNSLLISRFLSPVIFCFYFLFLESFFESQIEGQSFKKVIRFTTVLSIVSAVLIYGSYALAAHNFGNAVFTIYRVVMVLCSFWVLAYMLRHLKFSSTIFIVIGGIVLLIGSIIAMVFSWTNYWLFGIAPIHWLLMAVLIEILFFSAGLLFKAHQTEEYKNQIQESLLLQLQKNRSLQQIKQDELTAEVEKVKGQIEQETAERLSIEYELQSKEIELELLRKQMNPHFLFNSMNSLKRYILENKVDSAADYLDSFARLFRYIFENTRRKFVYLEDEISFLNEYVALENLRLSTPIAFQVEMDKDINPSETSIPALLLQPLVENSIWHGLNHIEAKEKSILLNIYKRGKYLCIEVIDNGIGLDIAEFSDMSSKRINSTEVNKQRLFTLFEEDASIDIASNGESGTKVTIQFPQV